MMINVLSRYFTFLGLCCDVLANSSFVMEGSLLPWMKEVKGIRHGGGGAYLRCPVFTTVQFSLREEGSSEYIRVCEGRESLRPNF